MKMYQKKIIAELNADQKMILDYVITRWCNPLEEGSTDEAVGDYDSGYYSFWGRRRGADARRETMLP